MKSKELEKKINKNLKRIKVKNIVDFVDHEIYIPSPDGIVSIGDFFLKERSCVKVRTETGVEDCVSVDHLFLTAGGWIKAQDCIGKQILTSRGFEIIVSVEPIGKSIVYDFEVLHKEHRYYTANGLVSHNTGKTFLTLNICREAQKMGYFIIYGDSEAAVDEEIMVKFGVDPSKARYQPFKTALHVRHFTTNLCKSLREKKAAGFEVPKILLVLDSMGNLATEKELSDALTGSDKRDMTKQQNLRSLFRSITMDLAELKIPFVVTNHTYQSVGGYFPSEIVSGGGGAIYNASGILSLSKAQLKDGEDEDAKETGITKTGIVVTSKIFKSRFTIPIPIKFHISFYKGMNPYVGLENYVSWDYCGIGRGKLIEEIIETPIWEDEEKTKPKIFRGKQKIERERTGNYIYEPDSKANTFAVKHLGKTIKGAGIFSPEVFTDDVLKKLDEKIKPIFMLPKNIMDNQDLNEAFGLDEEDENENTTSSHERIFETGEAEATLSSITEEKNDGVTSNI